MGWGNMKQVLQGSAFIVAAFYAALVHAEAPSAEIFGNLPLAEYGSLAPDGKHLAIIQPVRGRDGVMIYDLTKADTKLYAVAMEGAVAKGLFWKGNDRLIVTFVAHMKQQRSHNVFAWSRAVSVDATGDNAVTLMHGS